jgi:hypothetical protein
VYGRCIQRMINTAELVRNGTDMVSVRAEMLFKTAGF